MPIQCLNIEQLKRIRRKHTGMRNGTKLDFQQLMFRGLKLRPLDRISDHNFVHVLFRYISVSKCPCTFIRAPISNQQLIDASKFYDARSRNMQGQSQSCIYADTIQIHETNANSITCTNEQKAVNCIIHSTKVRRAK